MLFCCFDINSCNYLLGFKGKSLFIFEWKINCFSCLWSNTSVAIRPGPPDGKPVHGGPSRSISSVMSRPIDNFVITLYN